jgi:hypothetical protein
MAKKLTPEEKAARDARRAEQVGKAKGKKACKNLTVCIKDPDDDAKLVIIATENDGLRTGQDVADWMEKVGRVGTVYPFRFNECITRYEQKRMRTVVGTPKAESVIGG